jgi:hypothetical protein
MATFNRLNWQRLIISPGQTHRNIQLYIPVTLDQRYDHLLPTLRSKVATISR